MAWRTAAPAFAGRARVNAAAQVTGFTDVGYMTDYDPTHEYVLLGRAGLSFRQILTALATEPVSRSGGSVHSSRVAAGVDAELVVPDGDPAVRSPHWPASGMSYNKAGSSTTGRFHEDVAGRRLPIPRAVLSRLSRAASAPASVQELDG